MVTLAARVQHQCAMGHADAESLRHAKLLGGSIPKLALCIVCEVVRYCSIVTSAGSWSAADGAEAVEALWLFHTTMCRFIHSIAASSLAMIDGSVDALLTAMTCMMTAAACVIEAALTDEAAGTASMGTQQSAMRRQAAGGPLPASCVCANEAAGLWSDSAWLSIPAPPLLAAAGSTVSSLHVAGSCAP